MRDAGHRVRHVLQRGGDGDDLLDRRREARGVVAPVHEVAHIRHLVEFAAGGLLGPLAQKRARHRGLRLEDGHGNRALRRGSARGFAGDDVLRLETLIVYHVAADERAEAARARGGARFAVAVLLERLGHGGCLGDVVHEILIGEVPTLCLEHVHPLVGHLADGLVHSVEGVPPRGTSRTPRTGTS